jgi:tape measure domain-containing protein
MNTGTLEFMIRLKDLMTGGLTKVSRVANDTFQNLQKRVENANGAARTLSMSYDELQKKIKTTEQVVGSSRIPSQIKEARRELEALRRMESSHIGRVNSGSSVGGGPMVGALLRRLAPAAALSSAMMFANASVSAAMDYEATKKSFEVLTGSRDKGNALAENLNRLQQQTILGSGVFGNAKTMLGFGVDQDEVLPVIKMLGDISMGDAQKMDALTLAFSQVSAAGRLMGQDLLQFVNAGFNPLSEISEMTSKSVGTLRKEMEEGAISAEMITNAIKHATATGGNFGDMMEQIADTGFGKLQIMQGQWENFKIQFGTALTPLATVLMDAGSHLLKFISISETLPGKLATEQGAINDLVTSITSLNEGNATRHSLINSLVKSYPSLFGGIDSEGVKNEELLRRLKLVNKEYGERIRLAQSAYNADVANDQLNEIMGRAERVRKQIAYYKNNPDKEGTWTGNFKYLNLRDALSGAQITNASGLEAYYNRTLIPALRNAENAKISADRDKVVEQNLATVSKVRAMTGNAEAMKLISAYDAWVSSVTGGQAWPGLTNNYSRKSGGFDFSSFSKFVTPGKIANEGAGLMGGVGFSSIGGSKSSSDEIGRSIASGGPRVININGVKFADKIELHADSLNQGMNDLQAELEKMFLRLLNSGAYLQ